MIIGLISPHTHTCVYLSHGPCLSHTQTIFTRHVDCFYLTHRLFLPVIWTVLLSVPANSYEVEYAEVSFKKRRETEERRKLAETVDYGEVSFRKKGETEEKRTLAETVDYGEVRLPKPTCHTQQEDSVYAQVRRGQ